MNGPEQRRRDRSGKLAASLLGIMALVVAGATVSVLDLGTPWELVVYVAVLAIVLVAGTMWLVPSARASQPQPTASTTDPQH
ncbi:MAG: hypothetical protein WBP59_12725 [Ilumatobacteraceae bacterium]